MDTVRPVPGLLAPFLFIVADQSGVKSLMDDVVEVTVGTMNASHVRKIVVRRPVEDLYFQLTLSLVAVNWDWM